MAYLEINNIYKKWNEFNLDISFQSEENTFTSIVGPSGSGKSTTLRIIAGLAKNDRRNDGKEFSIFLDGKKISDLPANKRMCGMVFQNHSLFLNMNVIDNVAYGLKCRGYSKNDRYEIAREYLKKVELAGFEKRDPATLSGGEAQRVSLARTLIIKPKLILFDEPLSAIDAPLRKKLASEILNLQKEFGFTSVMVTHDLNEAKMMSDKIIILKNGLINWQGNSTDFREDML